MNKCTMCNGQIIFGTLHKTGPDCAPIYYCADCLERTAALLWDEDECGRPWRPTIMPANKLRC